MKNYFSISVVFQLGTFLPLPCTVFATAVAAWFFFLIQTSESTGQDTIDPKEVEIHVEFILDGVVPPTGEERVFPLLAETDPVIHDSEDKVNFNTNPPCADTIIHIKVISATCFIVFIGIMTF